MADYDIAEAFEAVENELIDSMMRNFSRHRAEETKEGYNWSQWQAEQLKSLEEYRKANYNKFNKQFSEINGKVSEMLKTARADGNANQEAKILQAIKDGFKVPYKPSASSTAKFFKVNDRKLNALVKATTDDLKSAETAILRMSNDKYRKAIYNAQVYANTGAGTYEKAVDMACKDMLKAGLNCVEYSNGARHTLSDYADMAIRTANKRAYLYGEGEKRAEWGISTVVVNQRQGGCPDCAQYIGQVFIDDVYSNGKKSDGNYPLLSTAIAGGLFHPRCKDSTSTYYEGITTLEKVSKSELTEMKDNEVLEQQKANAENQAKKCDRIAKYSLDEDNKRIYQSRAEKWQEKADEISVKVDKSVENSAESGIIDLEEKSQKDELNPIVSIRDKIRQAIDKPKGKHFVESSDIREALTDIGFDSIDNSFFSCVDERLQFSITDQLNILENKFAAVKNSKSPGIFADGKGTAVAGVGRSIENPAKQKLILSSTKFKNKNTHIKARKKEVETFFCMPCETDNETLSRYVVTHEYGHMLENVLIQQELAVKFGSFQNIADRYKNEIIKIAESSIENFNVDEYISSYGKKNSKEFFAECFANSQLGKPNALGNAMIKWLERRVF